MIFIYDELYDNGESFMNKKKSYMDIDNILTEGKLFDLLKKFLGVRKSISGMNKHVSNLEKIVNKQRREMNKKPMKFQRYKFSDFVDKNS